MQMTAREVCRGDLKYIPAPTPMCKDLFKLWNFKISETGLIDRIQIALWIWYFDVKIRCILVSKGHAAIESRANKWKRLIFCPQFVALASVQFFFWPERGAAGLLSRKDYSILLLPRVFI